MSSSEAALDRLDRLLLFLERDTGNLLLRRADSVVDMYNTPLPGSTASTPGLTSTAFNAWLAVTGWQRNAILRLRSVLRFQVVGTSVSTAFN